MAAVLASICAPASANSAELSHQNTVERLLIASGVTRQLAHFPSQTKSAFAIGLRENRQVPDAVVAKMLARADETILPNVMVQHVRESVSNALNVRSIELLLEWYESEAGRKITAAEEQASTAAAYQHIVNQAPIQLLNRSRVASARRIDRLVSATDMAMEIQDSTGVSIYSAMMAALAPRQPLDLTAYRLNAKKLQREVRASTHEFVLASMVYTYRDINETNLRAYEKFLAHPATRRFNQAAFDGISRGTKEALNAWTKEIAKIFRAESETVNGMERP